jgi:hypothetical protein
MKSLLFCYPDSTTHSCKRKGEYQVRTTQEKYNRPREAVRAVRRPNWSLFYTRLALAGGLVGCTAFQGKLGILITWDEVSEASQSGNERWPTALCTCTAPSSRRRPLSVCMSLESCRSGLGFVSAKRGLAGNAPVLPALSFAITDCPANAVWSGVSLSDEMNYGLTSVFSKHSSSSAQTSLYAINANL